MVLGNEICEISILNTRYSILKRNEWKHEPDVESMASKE
jgi:hypothetical protein